MKSKAKTLSPNPTQVRKLIGKSLREHRKKANLSQMGLGSEASLELSTIHRIESAKTDTSLSSLARIRKVLGVSWNSLLEGI